MADQRLFGSGQVSSFVLTANARPGADLMRRLAARTVSGES
jgi:hypothetical protein